MLKGCNNYLRVIEDASRVQITLHGCIKDQVNSKGAFRMIYSLWTVETFLTPTYQALAQLAEIKYLKIQLFVQSVHIEVQIVNLKKNFCIFVNPG